MKLIFGVHAHQPIGNPDEIIELAFERCYMPFLETLLNYPRVKVAFHIGGYLLEWAIEKRPEFIDMLKSLLESSRAEILGSGLYEPILSAIPRRDAIGQLEAFSKLLTELFGTKPKGAWITERVWEPCLPEILRKADIEYAFLDDYHFLCAGLKEENLNGYFYTEYNEKRVFLFPISQRLRYYIPFKKVESVLESLASIDGAGIIFDDYEKFGLWPETYEWVYERGWLKAFFELIQNGLIETFLPSEFIGKNDPLGLVYLPTSSYPEMGEWSLPPEKALHFRELEGLLEKENLLQRYKGLVRGGIWKNFLTKYPEANYMHKKMYFVSKLVEALPEGETKSRALKHLYRGQCNDAYWHGIFGGIYFPHLRKSVFKELSKAERIALAEESRVFIEDIDMDGEEEIYISTPKITCVIRPSQGGAIRELSFHPCETNLIDTLSRKMEHYHMIKEEKEQDKDGISTIHERIYKLDITDLAFDEHERLFGYEEISSDGGRTWISLINKRFNISSSSDFRFELELSEDLPELKGLKLKKRIELLDSALKIVYLLTKIIPIEMRTFFNIKLTSIDDDAAYLKAEGKNLSLKERSCVQGENLEIEDKIASLRITLDTNFLFRAVISPIYTISQTEKGFDRIYQASEIALTPLEMMDALEINFKLTKI